MRVVVVFAVLVLLLGGFALAWNYLDERQHKKEQMAEVESWGRAEQPHGQEVAQPPIKVRASEITRAFDTNVVDAEARYLRRRVLLDGWTKRVWKSVDGVTLLELKGYEFGEAVQCAYVGDFGFLSKIRPGMRVNIVGIVAGHEPLLGVIVANCDIEQYWE